MAEDAQAALKESWPSSLIGRMTHIAASESVQRSCVLIHTDGRELTDRDLPKVRRPLR